MTYLIYYYNPTYYCSGILSKISLDTSIAFSGVLIAVVALIFSIRLQIISFIEAQLIEIAKNCNSYLQHDYQVHENGVIERGRASGIVTALEDAEKIINYYNKKWRLIVTTDSKHFKSVFYNHLHSSIKVVLKEVLINKRPGFTYWVEGLNDSLKIEKYDPIRQDQLDKACKFFEKQINDTWTFEKKREKRLGITE